MAFCGYLDALQAMMKSEKREVDVSMMEGRRNKKQEGPRGG